MNKHNYYPPCPKEMLVTLYCGQNHTFREIAKLLGVSVKRVQTAMKYFGISSRKAIKRNQRGENNTNWKGDKAGYKALHMRLYNSQPNHCEICGTSDKNKTYDWANLTGDYTNPKDYKRMCRSCHRKQDNSIKNITG